MAISISLQQYLDGRGVEYDVISHDRTLCSSETAEAAGIPKAKLAKGVVVKNRDRYILAVVPASAQVSLDELGSLYERQFCLATESEVASIFKDCELGAVPAVAGAYGLDAVMDDSLDEFSDIYFEGGDHRTLVHLRNRDFRRIMAGVPHAHICGPTH